MKQSVSAVAATASRKSKNAAIRIRNLMDFLRIQARLEANKETFSQFLGLSDASVREDRFSFLERSNTMNSSSDEQESSSSLVFRYKFPPHDRLLYLDGDVDVDDLPRQRHNRPSLSTYTSILDEVTTFGIISADLQNPRPGVSVTMQAQWGKAHAKATTPSLEEVDIVTTITKKGRTLGFVRAEVRDPSNNDDVICYFDHIKYLPPGWMLGLMLTPVGRWCLDLYSRYILPYLMNNSSKKKVSSLHANNNNYNGKENETHSRIMESFQKTSDMSATFRFGPQHSNGFGGLHGGVQAILMERLGRTVARNELMRLNHSDSPTAAAAVSTITDVECERLQVSYQSSASRYLELRAHIIDPPRLDHPSVTLRIEILRGQKPIIDNGIENEDTTGPDPDVSNKAAHRLSKAKRVVVVSEGILTFVATNASSKTKEH